MRHRLVGVAAAVALAMAGAPGPARAWGNDGHRTIALIALKHLTPKARGEVERLLAAASDPPVASAIEARATWADLYRDSDENGAKVRYEATRRWHFVNIDVDTPDLKVACYGDGAFPAGTPASQGPAEDCIVRKIDQFRGELADATKPDAERTLALMFLLHLVGDLHQPLHAAERQKDQGGNLVYVVAATAKYGDRLHSYWDNRTVSRLGSSPQLIADALDQDITPELQASWTMSADPRDWAMESFGIAKALAYDVPAKTEKCPVPGYNKTTMETCHRLAPGYPEAATGQARLQLQRAGVRLADILNKAIG